MIASPPPLSHWLIAAGVVLLALLLGALVGLIVSTVQGRRRAAEATRWQSMPAPHPRVATGPTTRLDCCDAPDYPAGAAYCINCGRGAQ